MLLVNNISFSYNQAPAIENLSFKVGAGQHVAVTGESGCGKSTLLKLLYGMYDLDRGAIAFDGRPILGPKHKLIPGEDNIKYLAQDFDLMPFISVSENIGRFLSNTDKRKKSGRIAELLQMVNMSELADIKTQNLSGGQQQRVALATALALEPSLLLLDEPFSQIDTFRRSKLRRNLFTALKKKNITCVVATHDSSDVLAFADDVLVLKDGKLIVMGNPKTVYENRVDFYTASLFGEVNEIPRRFFANAAHKHENVLIYPHQLNVVAQSNLKVTVTGCRFIGKSYLLEASYESGRILFFENPHVFQNGDEVYLDKV